MADEAGRKGKVQSVEISVGILQALSRSTGPMTLSQIAAAVDMAPAKAHRYLASLVDTRMVKHRKSGSYDLGVESARIGTAAIARIDVLSRASDFLPDLVERAGCTAMLSVWGPFGATVVRWEKSSAQLITAIGVGATLPLLRSATGLAFLAWLPSRLVLERLEVEAPETTAETFRALREQHRRHLCVEVQQTFIPGLSAVAIPVLDMQGYAEGVITLVSQEDGKLAANSPSFRALEEIGDIFAPLHMRERTH